MPNAERPNRTMKNLGYFDMMSMLTRLSDAIP